MARAGKELRLARIFQGDGRALIVAMDHAYIFGPIKGLEKPERIIEDAIEGGADAILTTYGVVERYYELMKGRIGIVLRLDGGGSKYSLEDFGRAERWSLLYEVEDAIRLGADAVVTTILLGAPCEAEALKILAKLAAECESWGVPLAAEIIPVGRLPASDPEVIASAARIGAEYGADMIKTNYTGAAETFRKVVETCPIPVLIAGGPRMETDAQVLETVKGVVEAGGAGVFFGRNVFQSENPRGMVRALRKIIHENSSVEEALMELRRKD